MKHNYSPEFEQLWAIYPKRAGCNPKVKAHKAFTARLKQGYEYNDIHEGLTRYAAYCEKTAIIGSQFVLHASTFFGCNEYFMEPWDVPEPEVKETLEQKAARMGIHARPGESWEAFERRVVQTRG